MLNLVEMRNNMNGNNYCIRAGNENILITGFLTGSLLKMASPDIVILTGAASNIEKNIHANWSLKALVICPEVSQRFRIHQATGSLSADTVHFVRTEGAYYRRL
jgi:hypothetical protein